MDLLTDYRYIPWLLAMAALVCVSAFFSGSEAALFYLSRQDRQAFQAGNRAQRVAAALLDDPDRLLTAILFWNLVVNVAYFSIASIISVRLEDEGRAAEAGGCAVAFLLLIIFFGEMTPKSLGVSQTRRLATLVSVPIALALRLVDPLFPLLSFVTRLSRRVLFPGFRSEPYLSVDDLERAIHHSTADAELIEQEHIVLRQILSLSQLRVDELMRPRTQFLTFRPPVAIADLNGQLTPTGFLLISEADSDDVVAALPLKHMARLPRENLERFAEPVVYVPWCATVAVAWDQMQRGARRLVAVVNEYGETIGIVTQDDVLDTIFAESPSRSERIVRRVPIRKVREGVWHVSGMTSLRRLAHHFRLELPPTKSVTVAGVVQETLERLPQLGDRCHWAGFQFEVIESSERGQLLVELRLAPDVAEEPEA